MDLKHENGDPMFNAISISLICDACRKNGLTDCPHNEHEVPEWKQDKRRGALVRSIMSSDKTMYMRENAGVVAKTENNAFHLGSIDVLLNTSYRMQYLGSTKPPVFVCVDTAGGGGSCTAVISGIYTKSHTLLVRVITN
jgi:hypothetical protein